MYVFQIFDYFSASGIILLTICFCESLVLGWIYGADRFYDNIHMMIGKRITPYFKICWKFITPLLTLVRTRSHDFGHIHSVGILVANTKY